MEGDGIVLVNKYLPNKYEPIGYTLNPPFGSCRGNRSVAIMFKDQNDREMWQHFSRLIEPSLMIEVSDKNEIPTIEFWDPYAKNGWLSNFWEASISYRGKVYPTSEHLYQALKCDEAAHEQIRLAVSPRVAKNLAHEVGKDLPLQEKVANMRMVIRLKFGQNPGLRDMLIKTHGCIVETSKTDGLWGSANEGLNLMGLLLMDLRAELEEVAYQKSQMLLDAIQQTSELEEVAPRAEGLSIDQKSWGNPNFGWSRYTIIQRFDKVRPQNENHYYGFIIFGKRLMFGPFMKVGAYEHYPKSY